MSYLVWQRAGYHPSNEQLSAHLHPARIKLVAGGERAGKSFSAAMELLVRVNVPHGLFWIVGPDYTLATPEFDYVVEALDRLEMLATVSRPSRGQCSLVTKLGARVETKSSVEILKIAGKAPHGILMSEAAQQEFLVWLRLRGRLAETRGWLWASGTFEGSYGWYAETWQRWQGDNPEGGRSFSLPTWSNRVLFPGGRQDPEIVALERTYPADMFLERFGAVPCPPAGLVFREFQYDRHVRADVTYRPDLPVELAIDPGYAGAYAVLAMQHDVDRGVVNVVDEVYMQGATAFDVIEECEQREWWTHEGADGREYQKVTTGVIDIAGRQHAALPSHVEIWAHEAGVYLRSNSVSVVDGIARLRTFLVDPARKEPRIFFAPHCKATFAEFGKYQYPKVQENRPVKEEPVDANNHSMKALSYWLFDRFGPVTKQLPQPQPGGTSLHFGRPDSAPKTDMLLVDGNVVWGRRKRGSSLKFGR